MDTWWQFRSHLLLCYTFLTKCGCPGALFSEDTSEGGELDLEGLDDAELDGVCNAVQVSIFGISVQ